MMPTITEIDGRFEAVGALGLYFRGWEAEDPRAAIVIVHGLGEHSGRYEEFGRRMAAFGINSYAFDLRGHGLSDGRRGHVDRFELLLQDVDRFRREIEAGCPADLPVFLLGHSLGGLIALRYIEEYDTRLCGAIISAPWLATAMPVPRWKVLAAGFLNKALPALPLDNGLDPDYLSHDPQVVQRYRDDALVHSRITPRLFAESSTAMGLAFHRGDRIRMPVLFLLAGDDRIVDTRRSESFARSLQAPDVTIRVMDDYYHEVLNDHDREIALTGIREWIAARLP